MLKGPFFDSLKVLGIIALVGGLSYIVFVGGKHSFGNTACVGANCAVLTTQTSTGTSTAPTGGTIAGAFPSVTLTVNGSTGPLTVDYGQPLTVTWSSTNATSCSPQGVSDEFLMQGGGLWSDPTTTSGTVNLYARDENGTADTNLLISLQCFNGTGSTAPHMDASVQVDVTSEQAPDVNVYVSDEVNNRIEEFTSNGTYITQWGSYGIGNGQFNNPYGIAVAPSRNIYVADFNNNRVQEFTSSGAYITQWGSKGNGNGQFIGPTDIAIAPSGNVYVSDATTNLIQEFTSSGVYITQWGNYGTGNGELDGPSGIVIAPSGNVYVTDQANNRIQEFSASGTYINQWGGVGYGNGKFDAPTSITVAPSGNFYIVDSGNHQIQEFTPLGSYITEWGSLGSGNGQFDYPENVSISPSGNVYVTDQGNSQTNNRVEEFTSLGTYITQWGSYGTGNGKFNMPFGIAFAPSTVVPPPSASCTSTTTLSATQITSTSATLNGCYQSDGTLTSTYFHYDPGTTPIATPTVVQGYADGPAAWDLEGLTPHTKYYFQIISEDSSGTTYGQTLSFVTAP